ncbi:MAG: DegV family protein [Chloroflexi bacterium]|nr:DegV family protein [Chloroflexota bacterium]
MVSKLVSEASPREQGSARRVKIVTDSASDIPLAIARDLGITVVPCNVHFGERTYRDGVDLTSEEFFTKMASSPTLPTTSQPAVGVFEEAYRRLARETDQIISINLPAKLSATLNSARLAAQSLPELEIVIVDSTQVCMAQGWLAIIAAQAARQGRGLAEIVALIEDTIPRLRLIALLDTLEYLQKGGRIGKVTALMGTLLNVKPLLQVLDGEALPLENVRTRQKALRRLVEIVGDLGPLEEVAVMHANAPVTAQQLVEMLAPIHPPERILVGQVGAILGTHAGPGAVGVACVVGR